MSTSFSRRLFLAAPAAALLLGSTGLAARMMVSAPSDLDLSLSKKTEASRYVATIAADVSPIPVGAIHAWTVKVATGGRYASYGWRGWRLLRPRPALGLESFRGLSAFSDGQEKPEHRL